MVKTARSVYQIRTGTRAFRKIGGAADGRATPLGAWRTFERMGPVVVGRPLRFFVSLSGSSRQLTSVRTLTTSPVLEILGEDTGRTTMDAPSR